MRGHDEESVSSKIIDRLQETNSDSQQPNGTISESQLEIGTKFESQPENGTKNADEDECTETNDYSSKEKNDDPKICDKITYNDSKNKIVIIHKKEFNACKILYLENPNSSSELENNIHDELKTENKEVNNQSKDTRKDLIELKMSSQDTVLSKNIPNTTENFDKEAPKRVKDKTNISLISKCKFKILSALFKASNFITNLLETQFEKLGEFIANHIRIAIIFSLLFSGLAGLGIFYFSVELRPFKLWLPQNSDFIKILQWQQKEFPSNYRFNVVIYEGENVISSSSIKNMFKLRKKINEIRDNVYGKTFEDICFRVPTLVNDDDYDIDINFDELPDYEYDDYYHNLNEPDVQSRKKRDTQDISLSLGVKEYCRNVKAIRKVCNERSILEIWGYNENIIKNLTDQQVIKDINMATISQVFGIGVNFKEFLGGVEFDRNNMIKRASAAKHIWITKINDDEVEKNNYVIDSGSGQIVDNIGVSWESSWIEAILNFTETQNDYTVHAKAASSFGTVSEQNIHGDVIWLGVGNALMFMFLNINLGKRNLVEQRPLLAILGLFSIGQSILISYGLCSFIGIPYCPVNSIIPIILLGLGVDDMFVIMASWNNAHHIKNPIEKAAITMRHAGVAITVTSLTDVTAFLVGATTDLPALRSFCIYAAVGILFVYLFQITWFLSWVIIDEQRLQNNRDGCFWFYKYSENWLPSECSKKELLKGIFKQYSHYLMKIPVRGFILLISTILLSFSLYGLSNLRREFNPMWFIPQNSYLIDYQNSFDRYFKTDGEQGYIFVSNASFPNQLPTLQNMFSELEKTGIVLKSSFWNDQFNNYTKLHHEFKGENISDILFDKAISVFLHSSSGGAFAADIKFADTLVCDKPASPISVLRVPFSFKSTLDVSKQYEYKNIMNIIIDKYSNDFKVYAWAEVFSVWDTNNIIGEELWRNLILALIVVFLITLLLLANFIASILVMFVVVSTLVCVGCSIWLTGLTIDTVSCLTLVISVGISVDYGVHVAHAFLTEKGNTNSVEKMKKAMEFVGPPVLLGGFSTILAFCFLFNSNSHVFQTFFKIFTTSAAFGLYWGVVVLPVIISLAPTFKTSSTNNETINPNSKRGIDNLALEI